MFGQHGAEAGLCAEEVEVGGHDEIVEESEGDGDDLGQVVHVLVVVPNGVHNGTDAVHGQGHQVATCVECAGPGMVVEHLTNGCMIISQIYVEVFESHVEHAVMHHGDCVPNGQIGHHDCACGLRCKS